MKIKMIVFAIAMAIASQAFAIDSYFTGTAITPCEPAAAIEEQPIAPCEPVKITQTVEPCAPVTAP